CVTIGAFYSGDFYDYFDYW
nr:immunoglobulin heavy chain junction region [Macaca mulatta]MOY22103.1 immunoglobulin heavy chain junction region [Macaca mulatta]MOY22521.1 immunoglobulin heavy chain junction region [Macaca mulatta]MOY22556.1 immunoglobulin heavy chain junction region [Macaca mulatta]MOY22719.1 immunoglobulin heavy chain junction region [Macaca mulatta]